MKSISMRKIIRNYRFNLVFIYFLLNSKNSLNFSFLTIFYQFCHFDHLYLYYKIMEIHLFQIFILSTSQVFLFNHLNQFKFDQTCFQIDNSIFSQNFTNQNLTQGAINYYSFFYHQNLHKVIKIFNNFKLIIVFLKTMK